MDESISNRYQLHLTLLDVLRNERLEMIVDFFLIKTVHFFIWYSKYYCYWMLMTTYERFIGIEAPMQLWNCWYTEAMWKQSFNKLTVHCYSWHSFHSNCFQIVHSLNYCNLSALMYVFLIGKKSCFVSFLCDQQSLLNELPKQTKVVSLQKRN